MTDADDPRGRRAFERDGFACRCCGADGGPDAAPTRRPYPIGGPPDPEAAAEPRTDHENAIATLCTECYDRLADPTPIPDAGSTDPTGEVFRAVRTLTKRQGAVIGDVAAFASDATALPERLDSGESTTYAADRRDAYVALDDLDARIAGLEGGDRNPDDRPTLEADAADALGEFLEAARRLQETLREVIVLVETVASALGRCRCCFDPLDGADRCETCGAGRRADGEWRAADGAVRFDALFGAINETLRGASGTTEELTDRTTRLAEALVESN